MSLVKCMQSTFNILAEVASERIRQDAKWGPQDHPSIRDAVPPDDRAAYHGVISEAGAKSQCERRFANGIGTYADIAIEEVAEAVDALDDEARRAELVQCAAVFVAWVEAIDRRQAARALDSVSMDPPPTAWPSQAVRDLGVGETVFPPEVFA